MLPVFFSYLTYVIGGTGTMYAVLFLDRRAYPAAFWYYYLVTILVEFSVLVEISDHLFKTLPTLRRLGRAVTIFISVSFALFYVIPSIIRPHNRQVALLDFTVRASATKLIVIVALLFMCRQLGIKLGRNIGGLILGFSIYLGINVANYAAAKAFDPAVYRNVLWLMGPVSTTLCVLVWAIALWNYAPEPIPATVALRDSGNVAMELTGFNRKLSKYLER